MTVSIRPATPADLPLIAEFIRDLAAYEKLSHEVRFDEAKLGEKLFGPRPYAEVLIGELGGAPQGFALFFHNFSTFEGRRSEEHTSELQSLMRISYAVFCLKKQKNPHAITDAHQIAKRHYLQHRV